MEEQAIVYMKYVKVNEAGCIIAARTAAFVNDPENWIEAGTMSSRQWHPKLINDFGAYILKLSDGKIVDRIEADIEADSIANLKINGKAKIKAKAKEVILAKYPYWKQCNLHVKGTTSKTNTDYVSMKNWINSIRTQSDTLEAALDNAVLADLTDLTVKYTT